MATAAITLSACGGGTPVNAPVVGPSNSPAAVGQIQHIVVVMQENRTFDGLFQGYPGANTQNFGFDSHGNRWTLQPVTLANPVDINHLRLQFLENYAGGNMNGFDREIFGFCTISDPCACPSHDPFNDPTCWVLGTHLAPGTTRPLAYSFVPQSEVQPFWDMAAQYAIGDNFFPSNNGPSYVSHQYMIAGQSGHVAEIPSDFNQTWGCDAPASTLGQPTITAQLSIVNPQPSYATFPQAFGLELPGPFPCFSYNTIATQLDARGISWAFYSPTIGLNLGDIWSAFDVIYPVRFGADWVRNVKSPESSFFTDIQNGNLAQVTWVMPSFLNSDHAGSLSTTGPQWVANIVNAVGKSKYWNSTAIVIMYDDWGGWFDHVVPPQYADPRTGAYEGLGIRTPLIIVSPYTKRGYVSHVQHEVASSLHFIEKTFGLSPIETYTADVRADAFDDMFDFTQAPRPFTPIATTLTVSDFLRQKPATQQADY
ncbi:MAG TPA: alkaline phosphatase family protein [Candidatus Rubrimentiphilum sp.]|nr:alkaline phosphatase family protein [Candidatus Rubrimentiphilum sp.]